MGLCVDEQKNSKNRKLPTFATSQNSVMTSLWGILKTKELPPPVEATHNAINILHLYNFQNLVAPLLFLIKASKS